MLSWKPLNVNRYLGVVGLSRLLTFCFPMNRTHFKQLRMASLESRTTFLNIFNARNRIMSAVSLTPVVSNENLNRHVGRNVFFKAENLQKTGSFKARGALNAISILMERTSEVKGVVTHSSGNHGKAVAWAAGQLGLKSFVVVPSDAPSTKVDAIRSLGAEVVLCEPTYTAREMTCTRLEQKYSLSYIPTSDHHDVIAGQGTIGIEVLQQVPDLDAILVATSGGGMIAGIALAAKHIKPGIKVYMVEPDGKNCEECLKSGRRLWPDPPRVIKTIADGIRSQQLGKLTWPIILDLVETDVFTVTDESIIDGMKYSFENLKLVVEPAAGAAVAAVLSDKLTKMDRSLKSIAVILCGGNVDINNLPWMNIYTN